MLQKKGGMLNMFPELYLLIIIIIIVVIAVAVVVVVVVVAEEYKFLVIELY